MRRKNIAFVLVTLFLICFIGFCVGGTVVRGQSSRREVPEEDYQLLEAGLLRDTRQYLDRNGYRNSGVTLTRVIDETGSREYTFTIHHGRIDRMEECERQMLQAELARFCDDINDEFPEETCAFRHNFLVLGK